MTAFSSTDLYIEKGMTMKKKLFAMLALLGCLTMAGCANTVDGMGQDISKAGDAISGSVK